MAGRGSDIAKEVIEKGVRLDKLSSTHVYTILIIAAFGSLSYYCISSFSEASNKQMTELTRAVNKLAEIVNTSNGCQMAHSHDLPSSNSFK